MKRLSAEARSVLAEYRNECALAPADRQRMAHALEQRLAGGPPALELDADPPALPLDSIAPRALSRHVQLAGLASGVGLMLVAAVWFALTQHGSPPRAAPGAAAETAQSLEAPRSAASSQPPAASAPRLDEPAAASSQPPAAQHLEVLRRMATAPSQQRAAISDSRADLDPQTPRRARAVHRSRAPDRPAQAAPLPDQAPRVAQRDRMSDDRAPEPLATAELTSDHGPPPSAAEPERLPETSAPALATTMVDDELALLRRAQAALRAGDPQRALVQLAEHRWRFPNGQLADSRAVARMLALCANGDRELARAEAREFLAAHPRSPFAQRVRGICNDAPIR